MARGSARRSRRSGPRRQVTVRAKPAKAIKLCRIVTVPFFFRTLLQRQLVDVAASGIDVTLVASPGPEWEAVRGTIPARVRVLPISREPAPLRDLLSLARLIRYFRRERFDIVHSTGPKAGLLASIAGLIAGVPVRLHTFTGQPWVEMHGLAGRVARAGDKVTGRLTTSCYTDSASQRDFLISQGIVADTKLQVFSSGSIAGVDLEKFTREGKEGAREAVRAELGIQGGAVVIVFVGRVAKDKGIRELVQAFQLLRDRHPALHLLLVGPVDERAGSEPEVLEAIDLDPRIHPVGFQGDPERYLVASDIFCIPSYREGFGTVAVEAAALALPVVATRVAGLVDAVVDGQTGILIPAKDVQETARALEELIDDPATRQRMGEAGKARAHAYFDARIINGLVIREYVRLSESVFRGPR